jgi:hypothetical protein
MVDIYEDYCSGDNAPARLLTIYLEEAHAKDEWFFPDAPDVLTGDAIISTHQRLEERLAAAKKFQSSKQFPIELVVDTMDGEIVDRYDAWPERLFIIVDGVVVYYGGNGMTLLCKHAFSYLLVNVLRVFYSRAFRLSPG